MRGKLSFVHKDKRNFIIFFRHRKHLEWNIKTNINHRIRKQSKIACYNKINC